MEDDKISKLKTSEDIVNYIKSSTFNSADMVYKELDVDNEKIYIVYNEPMCNGDTVADYVVRSIQDTFQNIVIENIDKMLKEDETKVEEHVERKESLIQKIKQKKELQKIDKKIGDILFNLEKNIAIGKSKKIDLHTEDIFYYIF